MWEPFYAVIPHIHLLMNIVSNFPDYTCDQLINELFVSHYLVGPPFPPQYSSYDEQQYYESLINWMVSMHQSWWDNSTMVLCLLENT